MLICVDHGIDFVDHGIYVDFIDKNSKFGIELCDTTSSLCIFQCTHDQRPTQDSYRTPFMLRCNFIRDLGLIHINLKCD